jgi:hypothetical protein
LKLAASLCENLRENPSFEKKSAKALHLIETAGGTVEYNCFLGWRN